MPNTPVLGLTEKPSGNTDWYANYLKILRVMDNIAAPDNAYFVSPQFVDANLGEEIASASDRRHFATIQDAIDAAVSATPSYSVAPDIFVWPCQNGYQENLVIGGSVNIIGMMPPHAPTQGNLGVRVRGVTTVQSPVLTVSPPDGYTSSVNFVNMHFLNDYNQEATTIAKAYLADVEAQTTYGPYSNWIGFYGCTFRCQTAGLNNDWMAAFRALGWNQMVFANNCHFAFLNYAGGAYNGGMGYGFFIQGNTANGKTAKLFMDNPRIGHRYDGVWPTPAIFYINDSVSGVVQGMHAGTSDVSLIVKGGTGTNSISGLNTGDYNVVGTNVDYYGNRVATSDKYQFLT